MIVTFFVSNASAETIRFWTTEEQPARLAKQQAMAADFKKRTGHSVEVIPVSEKETAYLSGLFYSLEEALQYQKGMTKKGYKNSFIVAYKDGEKLEEF